MFIILIALYLFNFHVTMEDLHHVSEQGYPVGHLITLKQELNNFQNNIQK